MLITASAFALEVPSRPSSYVHDEARLTSPALRQKLIQGLAKYEADTGHQIVIATFPSLDGENLEDFSIRLAEKWKIGRKGADDGVILLIFRDDRKIRIEVGYGLEAVLTDAVSSQIISQVIAPEFRAGNTDAGIFQGVVAIMRAVAGDEVAGAASLPYPSRRERDLTPEEIQQMQQSARAVGMIILMMILMFFVIDCFRYRSYVSANKHYLKHYSFWEWWFRFAILLFILNIIFKILFYSMLYSRGGRYGGRSGFGGFSGGGGGSFGGGGASGGW